MKALSETQARKCENAHRNRCSCRCQGAMHGAARIHRNAPREKWEQLPPTDPHHLETKPMKEKPMPERIRNLTPERAANMLRHAARYLLYLQGKLLSEGYGFEVTADAMTTLQIAESKVRLGVDEIRA